MDKMKDYIKALRENKGYKWISKHGWGLNMQ